MGVPAVRLLRGALVATALGCLALVAAGGYLIADDLASHVDEVDGLQAVFGGVLVLVGLAAAAGFVLLAWFAPRAQRGIGITALVTGALTLLVAVNLISPWGQVGALVFGVLGLAQLGSAVAVLRTPRG